MGFTKKSRLFGRCQIVLPYLIIASLLVGQIDSTIARYSVIVISLIELLIIYSSMRIDVRKVPMLVLLYLFMVGYLISTLLLHFSLPFVSVVIQQSVLFLSFFMNYRACDETAYKGWAKTNNILLLITIILDILYFYHTNNDYFSVPIFGLSFLLLLYSRNKKALIIALSLLMFIVHGRSTSLAFAVMFVSYFLIEGMRNNKKVYSVFYWIMALATVYIPELYIRFFNSPYAYNANAYIRNLTGKNLFSGREILWSRAYELIQKNVLFGLGGQYYNDFEAKVGASTHNVFIFLRLEGGYLLLIIFLAFMYYLWMQLYKFMDEGYLVISAAYVVALFIRISFDLTFIANNFGQSVLLWIPIIIMLNRCGNNKNHKTNLPNQT